MEDWEITERCEQLKAKLQEKQIALNPVSEAEIQAWEAQWGVELPRTYRRFINEVTNGFTSQKRTILPLEKSMTSERGTDWAPDQIPADFLKSPFPHKAFYNPDFSPEIEAANELSNEEYARWWLNQLQGTMLLSFDGSGASSFLVVTGPSRGEVWCDLSITGQGYDRVDWDFFSWLKTAL